MKKGIVSALIIFIIAGMLAACDSTTRTTSSISETSVVSVTESQNTKSEESKNTESKNTSGSQSVSSQSPASSTSSSSDDTVVITDIKDYKKLGFDEEDPRIEYLIAFINKDIEKLEQVADVEKGVYESYKSLKLGDYSISANKKEDNGYGKIIFSFEVKESNVELLPVGKYTYEVAFDWGAFIAPLDYKFADLTPEEQAAMRLFVLNYNFSDYDMKSIKNLTEEAGRITEYLAFTFGESTEDQIKQYALELFGIKDFKPQGYIVDGLYTILPRGGTHWEHSVVSTEKRDRKSVV
jgi:hypothetical protein